MARAEESFIAKLEKAVEQGMWEVDTLILEGVHHVLVQTKDIEGPAVVQFSRLIPELAKLECLYIAKGKEEREVQVRVFLG